MLRTDRTGISALHLGEQHFCRLFDSFTKSAFHITAAHCHLGQNRDILQDEISDLAFRNNLFSFVLIFSTTRTHLNRHYIKRADMKICRGSNPGQQ